MDEYEGEEVSVFSITTLKRKDHVIRAIALPMNPKYEPWTKQIVDDWSDGNPWNLARNHTWAANRIVFDGLHYSTGKNTKNLANHGLRHIRIKELIQHYGFDMLEIQRFVGWTASSLKGIGANALMDIYFSLVWRDYFPKLLKNLPN